MINKIKKLPQFLRKNYLLVGTIFFIVLFSGVTHGINMFNYPYFENDEGTYLSQAWSLLAHAKLAPYTYWYDHAPGGWMFIALWTLLSGGFYTFGMSIHSGRVLMLLLHIASSLLLYFIARKYTKNGWGALIAVALFSLSPLAIYYQRRILLDNIMVFWILLSFALLLWRKNSTLLLTAFSGLCFSIAIVTKETAVVFLPGMLHLLHSRSQAANRIFSYVLWLMSAGVAGTMYVLYAAIKSELFPQGYVSDSPHVSLISTLMAQAARGTSEPIWNSQSEFYLAWSTWLSKDSSFVYLTIAVSVLLAVFSVRNKAYRTPALLLFAIMLFLARGKLVIDFYIIAVIPFAALATSIVYTHILKMSKYTARWISIFSIIFISVIGYSNYQSIQYFWTRNEAEPQRQAVRWIKQNLPTDTKMAIDAYAYVDLHAPKSKDDPIFPDAHWVWKVERDDAIRGGVFGEDASNMEYVLLTHEILKQVHGNQFPLTQSALAQSKIEKKWLSNTTSYIDLTNQVSTNGDWVIIAKYKSALDVSWEYYKEHFIISGQTIDPTQDDKTTSEGQSYALLRAVQMNDRETFDDVWKWTRDHLQYRSQDSLFSWLWAKENGEYRLVDSETASDADLDIALALVLASRRWNDGEYLNQAKPIISDIWTQEVVQISGVYLLTSSSNSYRPNGYIVNPSYFSPAHYRIFAQIDPDHNWRQLADDTYLTLEVLQNSTIGQFNTTNLIPNWFFAPLEYDQNYSSAKQFVGGDTADDYGFDAFRAAWRVGLDAQWNEDPLAMRYLQSMAPFFTKKVKKEGSIHAIYNATGTAKVDYPSLSTDTAALIVLDSSDQAGLAKKFYNQRFAAQYSADGYWGDEKNYYDQNWAWFATAYYQGTFVPTFPVNE